MSAAARDDRIDLRISPDLKALLSRAASYSGMSLSSFLVSIAADRAKEVVAEHETLSLTPRDWDAFLAVLRDTGLLDFSDRIVAAPGLPVQVRGIVAGRGGGAP